MSSGEPMEPFGSFMIRYPPRSPRGSWRPPPEDQIPHRPEPGLFVGLSQDVLSAPLSPPHPEVVKVAEEVSYKRLVPHGASVEAPHHGAEPRAAATARAEDPDDVLRPYVARRSSRPRAEGLALSHSTPQGPLEPRRQNCSSQALRRTSRPQGIATIYSHKTYLHAMGHYTLTEPCLGAPDSPVSSPTLAKLDHLFAQWVTIPLNNSPSL